MLLATLLLFSTLATADQNPAPTNVGLYSVSTISMSVSTVPGTLARNTARAGLIIQNNGSVSVVIKPGSASANITDGIVLTAGAILQMNPPPVDILYVQSTTAGAAKVILIENVK